MFHLWQKLEKMIPSDATGVISIDVPQILNKASFIADGKLQVPADLRTIIDENDANDVNQSEITDEQGLYVFHVENTGTSAAGGSQRPETRSRGGGAAQRGRFQHRGGRGVHLCEGLPLCHSRQGAAHRPGQ